MPNKSLSDEAYVIDPCDEALGRPALRQHRFDFLRGDARPGKQGARLPVDAYYPELQLIVKYRECRRHAIHPERKKLAMGCIAPTTRMTLAEGRQACRYAVNTANAVKEEVPRALSQTIVEFGEPQKTSITPLGGPLYVNGTGRVNGINGTGKGRGTVRRRPCEPRDRGWHSF